MRWFWRNPTVVIHDPIPKPYDAGQKLFPTDNGVTRVIGPYGRAVQSDGASTHLTWPHDPNTVNTGDLSVELMIWPGRASYATFDHVFGRSGDGADSAGTNYNWSFYFNASAGSPQCAMFWEHTGGANVAVLGHVLNNQKWVHIVAVRRVGAKTVTFATREYGTNNLIWTETGYATNPDGGNDSTCKIVLGRDPNLSTTSRALAAYNTAVAQPWAYTDAQIRHRLKYPMEPWQMVDDVGIFPPPSSVGAVHSLASYGGLAGHGGLAGPHGGLAG